MALFELSVTTHGYVYLKEELKRILNLDRNKNKLKALVNAKAIVMFPADESWDMIEKSLKLILEDIKLRKASEKGE